MNFAVVAALTIHDVKNNLMQLAAQAEKTGDTQSLSKIMQMSETLSSLLVFYKFETHLLRLNINAHSPSDLIKELAQGNQGLTKIKLETQDQSAPTLWFYDETLIRMVLSNALQNALRYARENIRICATVEDNQLEFMVQDDGPGYTPADLMAMEQTDIETPVSRQGTGLGLQLAKNSRET